MNIFSIQDLYQIILDRKLSPKEGSYTTRLFLLGEDEIIKKVGEEAIEVLLAAKSQGSTRLIEEISDLTYHLLVLMAEFNINPEDIQSELQQRHK